MAAVDGGVGVYREGRGGGGGHRRSRATSDPGGHAAKRELLLAWLLLSRARVAATLTREDVMARVDLRSDAVRQHVVTMDPAQMGRKIK